MANLAHYKSSLGHWLDKAKRGYGHIQSARAHVATGAQVVRQEAEGAAAGAGLAFMHVMLPTGLDYSLSKTSQTKIPLDAAAALALGAAAISMSGDETATDLRNLGAGCASVWGFRKGYDFFAAKRRKEGKQIGGKFAGEWSDSYGYTYSVSGENTIGQDTESEILNRLRHL